MKPLSSFLCVVMLLPLVTGATGCAEAESVNGVAPGQGPAAEQEEPLFTPSTSASLVAGWMDLASELRPEWYEQNPFTARADAVVALAMFEAANAIEQQYPSYIGSGLGSDPASKDLPLDTAVAAAATRALTLLYPQDQTLIQAQRARWIDPAAAGPGQRAAVALGESAAEQAHALGGELVESSTLRYPVTKPPRTRQAPGVYVPQYERSAIRAYDLKHAPWALTSRDQFRPGPPPALTDAAYAPAYDEAKSLGEKDGSPRTPTQTQTARFWFLIDMNPLLQAIAQTPGRSVTRNARMYAMFYMTTNDAWSAAADAKAFHQYWRPITAIPQAHEDGNPATAPQDGWQPLMATPPHPEYPCGHCVQASAQRTVLKAELDNPDRVFEVRSSEAPDAAPRQVTLDDYVAQTSESRIYAGAHFRFSNDAGEVLGNNVGEQVLKRWSR